MGHHSQMNLKSAIRGFCPTSPSSRSTSRVLSSPSTRGTSRCPWLERFPTLVKMAFIVFQLVVTIIASPFHYLQDFDSHNCSSALGNVIALRWHTYSLLAIPGTNLTAGKFSVVIVRFQHTWKK